MAGIFDIVYNYCRLDYKYEATNRSLITKVIL